MFQNFILKLKRYMIYKIIVREGREYNIQRGRGFTDEDFL